METDFVLNLINKRLFDTPFNYLKKMLLKMICSIKIRHAPTLITTILFP